MVPWKFGDLHFHRWFSPPLHLEVTSLVLIDYNVNERPFRKRKLQENSRTQQEKRKGPTKQTMSISHFLILDYFSISPP